MEDPKPEIISEGDLKFLPEDSLLLLQEGGEVKVILTDRDSWVMVLSISSPPKNIILGPHGENEFAKVVHPVHGVCWVFHLTLTSGGLTYYQESMIERLVEDSNARKRMAASDGGGDGRKD